VPLGTGDIRVGFAPSGSDVAVPRLHMVFEFLAAIGYAARAAIGASMGRLPLPGDFPSNVELSFVPRKCVCVRACVRVCVCPMKAPEADSDALAAPSSMQLHQVHANVVRELRLAASLG